MARQARSLDVLLAEVNAVAPKRSKVSDGGLGDSAHQKAGTSDHLPNKAGVWRARDFTHDPTGGLDCNTLTAALVPMLGKHPALGSGAYLIWNARIISTDRLGEGWRKYTGANAHRKHAHVSVATAAAGYDSTAPWGISTPTPPAPNQEDNMLVIGKPKNDPQHWIGDGITCRRIANEATLKNIKYLASEGMLTVFENGAVQPIDDIWALGHPIDDDFALTKRAIEQVAVKTGVVIDYAAIAKAVNDEAAKRLGVK